MMTQLVEKRPLTSNFGPVPDHAPAPQWLERLRRAGAERFDRVGFPTTHEEEWRQTNVAPLAKVAFRPAERDDHHPATADLLAQFTFGAEAVTELVFVNGHFAPHL